MPLYRLSEPGEPLSRPAIVAALDGWIDAAGASTAAASRIADDGEAVATFDTDLIFDFRSRRPVLDIVDGTLKELTWPELSLRRSRIGERDLLILTGAEPDFRWGELGRDLVELAQRLGVVEWVSLGSIPTAVPHTRPVPVLATASHAGLLDDDEQQGPAGLLRVPSAALSTLELAVAGGGLPSVGFYAQVPHYLGGPYAAASIAILEHAGRHLEVDIPLGALPDEAMAQRQRLDQIVQANDESRAYVEQLESVVDNQEMPTGDELVSEIERFLQERGDGSTGQGPLA
jgi:proteasome assembly chaperone (PAC2) family protein